MNPEQLAAIEARANAATPQPWESLENGDRIVAWKAGPNAFDDDFTYVVPEPMDNAADAEFIAHARQDVPALLAEVKQLRAELESLQEDSAKLNALEVAGVDNWDGYSHAMEILGEGEGR